jgi:hypothetical protein
MRKSRFSEAQIVVVQKRGFEIPTVQRNCIALAGLLPRRQAS